MSSVQPEFLKFSGDDDRGSGGEEPRPRSGGNELIVGVLFFLQETATHTWPIKC
jgi:hypothetical protein